MQDEEIKNQVPIDFSEEDIDKIFEEAEDEPDGEEPVEPLTPLSPQTIEERYKKSQLRVLRTNIDFSLHNLHIALKDPNYINFSPSYQRRDRWDTKKRSLLIESLLMNIPIPSIFLYENKYNQYEVMDGRQRLETLRDFLNDGFRLRSLEYWKELHGRKFSTLPETIQLGLLRRTISAIVLLAETSEQKGAEIDVRMALFQRLNTGGVRLNPQELRNALYPSNFKMMLMGTARSDVFTRIWGIPPYTPDEEQQPSAQLQKNTLYKTMADCELVLRFFAIKDMIVENLGGSLRQLLDKCMVRHQEDTLETVGKLREEFLTCLNTLDELFDHHPFVLPATGRPSHTLYDSLMVALALKGPREVNPTNIQDRLAERLKTAETYNVLVNRFNTIDSIKARIELASEILFGEGQ